MGLLLGPFFANNTFESGQSMILGANNVAYGSGLATVAFDVTSGAKLWSTPFLHPTGLVVATADGRLIATELTSTLKQAASASALKIYDSQGVLTALPFNPAAASIAYFDANSLALILGGQGELMAWPTPVPIDEENPYNLPGGNPPAQRARTLPKISSLFPPRGLIGTSMQVTLTGTRLAGVVSIDAGRGITATVDPTNTSDTSLKTTFVIDQAADAGEHDMIATLKNGKQIQSKQNFFVQIPAQLQRLSAGVSKILPSATANGCPAGFLDKNNPGPFGMKLVVRYQVLDQQSPGRPIVATMPVREDLLNILVDGQPTPGDIDRPVTASGATDSDGTFIDDPVGGCNKVAFHALTFMQRLFVPLAAQIRPTVRTNNFSQTGDLGCGSSTNGADIKVTIPCN
jgi:hypothetical protein